MSSRDDFAKQTVEVVLRFPDENGIIDTTDCGTLEKEARSGLLFKRATDGGIGELAHPLAFVTWVVPLAENTYRIEDLWHRHPLRTNENEEAPGGLAFRDVFVARRLADGSLLFDRVLERAEWRIDYWMLPPPSVWPQYLEGVVAKIEALGGYAEQDPWIGNWLWTFLPPETDYDPTTDIAEALQRSLRK
jgi:hypothetical protein